MAPKVVVYVGFFLFLALTLTQMGFFLALQVKYLHLSKILLGCSLLYLFFCLYSVTTVLFIIGTDSDRDTSHLRLSTVIWTGYVVFILIPNIIAIFGHAVRAYGLIENAFLGPYLLKSLVCVTPFALLLLINTVDSYKWYLTLQMTIDLFDVTEMLAVVLKMQGQGNDISQELSLSMIAVACFAYLLTSMHLEETKVVREETKTRFKTTLARNVLQMIIVNSSFLLFRLSLKQWKDELIFISKNIIGIFHSLWRIAKLFWKRPAVKRTTTYSKLTNGSE